MDVGPKDGQPESDLSRKQDGELMAASISCRSSRWGACAPSLRTASMGSPRLVSLPILAALILRAAVAAGSFTVDQVVEDLNLPADTAERIRSGGMVHSDPTESSEREMAVGLTFLVQHPLAGVVKAFLAAHRPSGTPASQMSCVCLPVTQTSNRRDAPAHPAAETMLSPKVWLRSLVSPVRLTTHSVAFNTQPSASSSHGTLMRRAAGRCTERRSRRECPS